MRKSTSPSRFSKLLAVTLPIRSRGSVALSVALCGLLLVGVCSSASAQSFTFTTFEAPGASTTPSDAAQGTFAASINNSGVITGLYVDAGFGQHGYLRAPDGTFTTFDDVTGGCGGLNPIIMNNS